MGLKEYMLMKFQEIEPYVEEQFALVKENLGKVEKDFGGSKGLMTK